MLIYIVVLIYLLALAYNFDFKSHTRGKRFNYTLSCIVLILVAGFRYRIGFDTINYMQSYLYAPSLSEIMSGQEYSGDPFWALFYGICKEITNEFFIVQLIQSTIVNVLVFRFIRRHSPKPFVGVLLFYILMWWNLCFEAMREALAVSFFLFALDGLLSGKGLKSYYLRVWPAIFFHTFGFVTLLFPLIRFFKVRMITFIVFGFAFFLVFYIKDYINDLAIVFEMVSESATDKTMKYLDSDTYGESSLSLMGILSMVLGGILPGVYIVMLLYKKDLGKNTLVPYVLVYIFIVILRMQVPIFFRFLNYFELLVIVAFTQAITLEKITIKRQFAYIAISVMVMLRLYSLNAYDVGTSVKAYHRYVPYNSIFQRNFNKASETIFNS